MNDPTLARFCSSLPQLRAAVTRLGLADELAAVLVDVRAGAPLAELLPRLGIPGDTLGRGGFSAVPGLSGRATGEVYVCPWDACDRAVGREPGGPVPVERCWVVDEPLRKERA